VAEEAQELTVTNTGQPLTVDLEPAVTPVEVAQELQAYIAANVTVDIDPAND
jgi:hypothetical protein